jgi:hypothetical protein
MENKYTYYLKIYSYMLENNIYFCFDNGKPVFRKDCEKFFNTLFESVNKYPAEVEKEVC